MSVTEYVKGDPILCRDDSNSSVGDRGVIPHKGATGWRGEPSVDERGLEPPMTGKYANKREKQQQWAASTYEMLRHPPVMIQRASWNHFKWREGRGEFSRGGITA